MVLIISESLVVQLEFCNTHTLESTSACKVRNISANQCLYIYIYFYVFSKHNAVRPVDHHNWLHHQSQLHQPVAHLNELILCRFSYDFEGLDVHAHKRLFTAKNGHSRKLHGISLFFTVYSRSIHGTTSI